MNKPIDNYVSNNENIKIKVVFVYSNDKELRIAKILEKKLSIKFKKFLVFSFHFHKNEKRKKLFVQLVPLSPLCQELGILYSKILALYVYLGETKMGKVIKNSVHIDSIVLER